MSKWTHSLCVQCWNGMRPGRQTAADGEGDREKCCRCGRVHSSGIYVREDPANMACGGKHEGDDD